MNSLGVQPDAPKLAKTPLELLTIREGEGFNLLDRYWLPVMAGLVGFYSPIVSNIYLRKPRWSGIYQHFGLAAILYFFSDLYIQHRMKRRAEEFEVIKHYISLHPEDFPPYERTKIKYLYDMWHPTR